MAKILPFAKGKAQRVREPGERLGEIVIFTGIRVEYHDCHPSAPTTEPPRGRRRPSKKNALSA